MQTSRRQAGYTLVEVMIVVAIIGILSVVAFASLKGYAKHEDTRRAALSVAGVLTKARAQAMSSGHLTFVLFAEPTDGSVAFAPGQYAALVVDENGSGLIDFPACPICPDAVTPIFLPSGINPDVSGYGAHGPTAMAATVIPAADEAHAGDLTTLNDGTTFPIDPVLGVPVVAFAAQGSAVTPADPSLGSGRGGVYLTDNDKLVFAVVVLPLGDVRTMAYDSGSGKWK